MAVVPADQAWLGIQELHHACIGDGSFEYLTDAGGLDSDEAFLAYSNAVAGALGQIAGTSPLAADTLLGSLTNHIDLMGSMDGLEGLGLSAFGSAAQMGVTTGNMEAFESVLQQLGIPDIGGGGLSTSAVFDRAGNQFGMPSTGLLQQALGGIGGISGGPSGELIRDVIGFAASEGASLFGAEVAADFKRVGEVLGATGAGAAEGALIGGMFGPAGAAVGGVVGGVIGFFSGLFGGDEGAPARQQEAGRGVAEGTSVPVAPPAPATVININITVQIGKDGTPGPAPAGANPPSGSSGGGSGQCLVPRPEKCPVDDDGQIDPDFAPSFWRQDATWLGSASPIGSGVEGLSTATNAGAMLMAPFPIVDTAAALLDGGQFLEVQYNELNLDSAEALSVPKKVATETPADLWGAVKLATRIPGEIEIPVVETEIVDFLVREGIDPSTPARTVVRQLRRRYPAQLVAAGRGWGR